MQIPSDSKRTLTEIQPRPVITNYFATAILVVAAPPRSLKKFYWVRCVFRATESLDQSTKNIHGTPVSSGRCSSDRWSVSLPEISPRRRKLRSIGGSCRSEIPFRSNGVSCGLRWNAFDGGYTSSIKRMPARQQPREIFRKSWLLIAAPCFFPSLSGLWVTS